jgi:choline dehydrogenase-like flavoprotein
MRVGPVAITNGSFGNRPHCIYRGFCLEGCKVNSKASPLITHLPDAIEHGVEVRADSTAMRVETNDAGRVTVVTYVRDGATRFQPADAVALCGYAIETPRLLLHSTRRFPNGLANGNDQVGRYVMVQGATQVAARFPDRLVMYKAPPPQVSSEQFYETDERSGFARGFSIQTLGPLPIEWAAHVVADGHWGAAPREYMRDYNHWTVPVARFDYSLCKNDRANIAFATKTLNKIWEGAGAQDSLKIDRYAHLVGGCRMGFSPEGSVVDSSHRAWEVPNLFVCDGRVLPMQGAANPALAIMALADRLGELLKDKRAGAA